MIQEGQKAPGFSLPDQDGTVVSLDEFRGRKVVLYFYPKDNTSGCTVEACGFRDVYDEILSRGAVVVGISADSSKSHANFRNKYELPFHLLSDTEKEVIQSFGAWGEKKMYGKTYMGIVRSTFIIDEKGIVTKVFPKVTPKEHAAEVLALL